MGHTIAEKILARYCDETEVFPGMIITVKDFVGPIGYSFTGYNFLDVFPATVQAAGLEIKHPERFIVNGDHNTPPKSISDVELFKSVREKAETLGVKKVYDREGIGHIVNIEKGDIQPGKLFVNYDPQAMNAGGIGALYSNGGRLGTSVFDAFAFGEMTIRAPETIRIKIDGELPPYVMGRDVWMNVLNTIGPDSAHGMVLEFCGSTIDQMSVEQRMILCGSCAFAGADSAIIAADEMTVEWFRDNFGMEIELINSDEDALFEKTYSFDAEKFVPMVTYPPKIFTSKPAKELGNIKVNQCILGTCAGGCLEDIAVAASILRGRKVKEGVRMLVSPATQRIYVQASKAGYLAELAEAGAMILAPSCDVCLGVQGPLAAGEVGLSQQTLNIPGRSGSPEADIYIANAATIAASAITGYITDPSTFM